MLLTLNSKIKCLVGLMIKQEGKTDYQDRLEVVLMVYQMGLKQLEELINMVTLYRSQSRLKMILTLLFMTL